MGTQQILLIVLGTIAVGIAIFAGVNLVQEYIQDQNRQLVYTTLYQLADIAVAHYKKPSEMGGGGGSYTGLALPQGFGLNDVGRFRLRVIRGGRRVNLIGIGNENGRDGRRPIRLILRVESNVFSLIDRN